YGYKSIILAVMKILGENNVFTEDNVITPKDIHPDWREGYEPPTGYNKNSMLNLLCKRYQCQPNNVLLLDDSWTNIINAKQNDFCTIHLAHGYHRYISTDLEKMDNIEDFFNKSIVIPCK